MDVYTQKRGWKLFLIFFALAIGAISTVYTNYLASMVAAVERRNAELWAISTKMKIEVEDEHFLDFLTEVQKRYTDIPAIIVDSHDEILQYTKLDSTKTNNKNEKDKKYDHKYFMNELAAMKKQHPPIAIEMITGEKLYVYYKDSSLLTSLKYFPYRQLTSISVFLIMSYLAFSSSRRSEQNQVWVGMAKETAHQLGTPISSMMAWLEILKEKYGHKDQELLGEMEHDIVRLQVIVERFSKIGSVPVLEKHNVLQVVSSYMEYLGKRLSRKIKIEITGEPLDAELSIPLFEWVLENLCKNAANAIGTNEGKIVIAVSKGKKNHVYVDVMDTGGGIPKSKFETVFQPGYTTRKRGWGLGLTLTRRIVENYHKGQIVVKESEIGKGTTFRVTLNG
ncbi:sensor histidine kinase [Solitalea koreensis]|uniref:histidine kinase n=1 Tax=Solitalea koreensis TaxID=543615 RepID=A0A521BZH0_9SPHI|nr:HAMP domain-containing sensor histidine kinase [Solitalea koreensis]SMO51870.1 His Kinase A (phospho-acceptor) domain-containing protein [Solitalea koreensis]